MLWPPGQLQSLQWWPLAAGKREGGRERGRGRGGERSLMRNAVTMNTCHKHVHVHHVHGVLTAHTEYVILRIVKAGCRPVAIAQVVEH